MLLFKSSLHGRLCCSRICTLVVNAVVQKLITRYLTQTDGLDRSSVELCDVIHTKRYNVKGNAMTTCLC